MRFLLVLLLLFFVFCCVFTCLSKITDAYIRGCVPRKISFLLKRSFFLLESPALNFPTRDSSLNYMRLDLKNLKNWGWRKLSAGYIRGFDRKSFEHSVRYRGKGAINLLKEQHTGPVAPVDSVSPVVTVEKYRLQYEQWIKDEEDRLGLKFYN
ncbi:hypothetical protein BDC45DRAFT_582485 [Circinella umbellata]|nr:hypothetical protein BDC45DRAFT_582485 [Circinella umbellata]